ncbi:MAG: acyl carrier protein [Sulfurifustaceae bacterium]
MTTLARSRLATCACTGAGYKGVSEIMGPSHSSQAHSDMTASASDRRLTEIRDWLIAAVAERTRLPRSEIRSDEPIYRYGIDSLERVNLAYQLERWIGFEVSESTLAELETIDEVAAHLIRTESAGKR